MAFPCSIFTSHFIPAADRTSPLQHMQVPAAGSVRVDPILARNALVMRPLQQIEVPAACGLRTTHNTLSTSIRYQPLKCVKLSASRCAAGGVASVGYHPPLLLRKLQQRKVAS